jgi:aldose 1-epimerase
MNPLRRWLLLSLTLLATVARADVTQADFGRMPDGTTITLYTLRNAAGVEAQVCTYGGILTSLKVPDRHGALADIVLGYDNLGDYLKRGNYFGALIGRYANRIAFGKFKLDGHEYAVPPLYGPHSLHGGLRGFDKVAWTATVRAAGPEPVLELRYLSRAGEEGFPGNLQVTATYTLQADNTLRLEFSAVTDAPTICSLTNHSYFNLAGRGDVLGHVLQVEATRFTPIGADGVQTGEIRAVSGTPFDFTRPTAIGARINADDGQLKLTQGYDQNFVITRSESGALVRAATVSDPASGRTMELWTTAPGLQFYSANFMSGLTGKGGWKYQPRQALCLEPQEFPDAPNHANFPSPVLRPGQTYHHAILYRFPLQKTPTLAH